MEDNDILKFIDDNGLIGKQWKSIKKYYPDFYEILKNRYNDTQETDTVTCIAYRLMNGIEIRPVCPVCGKPVGFNNNKPVKFKITCGSDECKSSKIVSDIRQERTVAGLKQVYGENYLEIISEHRCQTIFEKFGNRCVMASDEYKWKCQEKRLKAFREKFGCDNPMQCPEICEKQKQTCRERFGYDNVMQCPEIQEKSADTCERHFGVRNPMQSIEIQKKAQETCEKRYNARNPMQCPEIQEHAADTCEKIYGVRNPMQNNEIFMKSMSNRSFNGHPDNETMFADYLKTRFLDVKTQYKTIVYPYHCDIYISDIDLYIEIQGHWTHGPHPFNNENNKDIEILEKWKTLTYKDIPGNSNSYTNAIQTWTINDVKKRETARNNHLNYFEIFSSDIDEIIKIFNNYYDVDLENKKYF